MARPVALVDAARIQSNLSLQDGEFATLRQFKNVGVVGRRLRHTVVRLDDMCLLIGFKKELRREGGGCHRRMPANFMRLGGRRPL